MTAATGTNTKEKKDKARQLPSVRRNSRNKKMGAGKVRRPQRKRRNSTRRSKMQRMLASSSLEKRKNLTTSDWIITLHCFPASHDRFKPWCWKRNRWTKQEASLEECRRPAPTRQQHGAKSRRSAIMSQNKYPESLRGHQTHAQKKTGAGLQKEVVPAFQQQRFSEQRT